MKRTHILFVANEVLGWATYSEQLRFILAQRTDVYATIIRRRPSRLLMGTARRHADSRLMKHLRPFDPIRLYAGALGREIRKAISTHRPDVVHFAAHWPAGAIAGMQGAPPYTLALDSTRASIGRDLPLAGWSAKDCATESALCNNAAYLFPMSNWARSSLAKDYGIADGKIHVMPPSLALDQWPNVARGGNAVAQILFIGNNLKRKGADRLARWVSGPLQGRCHLHIVSTDQSRLPDGRDITFHGAIPHDQLMSDLMPKMDIFCLPTRLDMSPFVLTEATAAGLPSVASNIGGIADLIENEKTGYLISSNDDAGFVEALSTLIDNVKLRQTMGQHAVKIASERFNADHNFNALIDRLIKVADVRASSK